jgi:hypothetical protein
VARPVDGSGSAGTDPADTAALPAIPAAADVLPSAEAASQKISADVFPSAEAASQEVSADVFSSAGAAGQKISADVRGHAARGSLPGRAWRAWRRWRRTRPFWGGLLILLSGLEILVSERAPMRVMMHIGLQGAAGYLLPVILALCGLLLWLNPQQRMFYSIVAALMALGSWLTSNLGGFFLGILLGVIGSSLAFAWTPRPRQRSGSAAPPPASPALPDEPPGGAQPAAPPPDLPSNAPSTSDAVDHPASTGPARFSWPDLPSARTQADRTVH